VATADTWVQVTEGETLLLTRVLHPGDRFIAPKREGLKLMTGNAGGLELKVDNKVMRSLGEQGKVLRDVSLDAKALQQQFSQ
jgi:cytoskeleton protein RodZ